MYSSGNNRFGQLGLAIDNGVTERFTLVKSAFDGSGIKTITSGSRVTAIITNASTLWVAGNTPLAVDSGKFNLISLPGEKPSCRVTHVAIGMEHIIAVAGLW